MNTVEQELATAREWLQATELCLVDCQERFAETKLEFYRVHAETDKMSIEFWQGQIKYLEGLIQKKSVTDAVTPLQIPVGFPQARTGT